MSSTSPSSKQNLTNIEYFCHQDLSDESAGAKE
jgi:hypothetical protein